MGLFSATEQTKAKQKKISAQPQNPKRQNFLGYRKICPLRESLTKVISAFIQFLISVMSVVTGSCVSQKRRRL